MKKVWIFLIMLVPFFAFGQLDDEEAQFFGTRSLAGNSYDFQQVKSTVSHTFSIKNNSSMPMKVIGFEADEGLTITLLNKEIPARGEGKFTVSIDPKNLNEKGDFSKKLVLIVEQAQENGVVVRKKIPYVIKGSL